MSSDLLLLSYDLCSIDEAEVEALERVSLGGLAVGVRRYVSALERRRFLSGRLLLRYGLRCLTGVDEAEIRFNEYLRPFLADLPSVDFNIAHSGDWVLCAMAFDRRIGVDVELLGEYLDEVVERFADSEIAAIRGRSGQERTEALYRIWTAKEAYLKAEGSTFLVSLDRFSVANADGEMGVSLPHDESTSPWNLLCGSLDRRHPYAICYSGGAVECAPARLTTDELTLDG